MITQSNQNDIVYPDTYSTPLARALGMIHQQPEMLATPNIHSHRNVFPTPTSSSSKQMTNPSYMLFGSNSFIPGSVREHKETKNLLPPVAITKDLLPGKPLDGKKDFLLKLTIDDLGKAVLSNDLFQSALSTVQLKQAKPSAELLEQKLIESPINDMDFARVDSAVGLETRQVPQNYKRLSSSVKNDDSNKPPAHPGVLRRHHSDITGISSNMVGSASTLTSISEFTTESLSEKQSLQMPQTPKQKDTHFLSTGLTPSNLNFNLTPNFNSMMYSIMNINSPQQKKTINSAQFLSNQDFFMNGLSGGQQSSPQATQSQNTVCMNNLMNNGANPRISNSGEVPYNSQTPLSSEDSGDARLALKKIIQIKKK